MNTPAIDRALTLLGMNYDDAAGAAGAELRTLKSRLAELESRRPGDVRVRTVKSVRWRVEYRGSAGSYTFSDSAARLWKRTAPGHARIIRITTYAVTRPVVRESRTEDLTGYQPIDGVGHVSQALCSEGTGMAWASWAVGVDAKDVGGWPRHATRTEAEQACRKALRDMGYRVERAKS